MRYFLKLPIHLEREFEWKEAVGSEIPGCGYGRRTMEAEVSNKVGER